MAIVSWTAAFQLTPNGAVDPGSVLDDRIKELKEQISLRGEQGGHGYYDDPNVVGHGLTPNSAHDGRHVVDAGGAGVSPDVYESDGTTVLAAYTDTAIAHNQPTTGTNITTGNNPGHGHDSSLVFYLPTVSVGRVPGVIFYNRGNGTLTLLEAYLLCWTAPGAGGIVVDVHHLDTSFTDPNSTAADDLGTVFTVGFAPTCASGIFLSGAATIDVTNDTLAVDEAWVFEIDSNDAADDIHVILKVRRV